MASASALAALQKGLDVPSYDQAQSLKVGPEAATLNQADTRRLLLIEAAESGDLAVLQGRKLEQLGRAETVLQRLAKEAGVSPLEMRNTLRQAAEIDQQLFDAVAAGQADPAEALAQPGRTAELVAMDQADNQAAAEQQAQAVIPDAVLTRFNETIRSFGSAGDAEPALAALQGLMTLSPAGRYAIASSLIFE
jgi:hypothetical protein